MSKHDPYATTATHKNMPEKTIIDATVRAIKSLPGWHEFRILDLSCGDGEVIEVFSKAGCQVEGTQFREDDYIYNKSSLTLTPATIHKGIDLSGPLPFSAEVYDVVIATEVLEHLPNHALVISEAGRILKRGGYFIFTTPNIHRLSSRLRFLFTGQHNLIGARLCWNITQDDLYSKHFNPVYFPVVHTLLHFCQLHIKRIALTKWKWRYFFLAVLYPVVYIAVVLEMRDVKKRSRSCARDLSRWMMDPRMLFSEQLLVVSEKN